MLLTGLVRPKPRKFESYWTEIRIFVIIKTMKRLPLLDFYRGVAILCVVADHVFAWLGVTDSLTHIHRFLIFSVSPLFALSGFTFAWSYLAKKPHFWPKDDTLSTSRRCWQFLTTYFRFLWSKLARLLGSYLLATAIIMLWTTHSLSLSSWWQQVITFPGPFYFISIYIQLIVVAPFFAWSWQQLFALARSRHFAWSTWWPALVWLLVITGLSLVGNQLPMLGHTIYYPARLPLGGIELLVFNCGVVAANLAALPHSQRRTLNFLSRPYPCLLLGTCSLAVLLITGCHQTIFAHPPRVTTLWYVGSVLLLLTGVYQLCQRWRIGLLLQPLCSWGRWSLGIFIYHDLFIREWLLRLPPTWHQWPIWRQIISLTLIAGYSAYFFSWLLSHILPFIQNIRPRRGQR